MHHIRTYIISFIIGEIRCSGSSLFLKTRFGVGYILSISKNNVNIYSVKTLILLPFVN